MQVTSIPYNIISPLKGRFVVYGKLQPMLVWKELNGNNLTISYTSTIATHGMGYNHHDGRSTCSFKDYYIQQHSVSQIIYSLYVIPVNLI